MAGSTNKAEAMDVQTITTPGGERLVLLSEVDYGRLVQAAEDRSDLVDHASFRRRLTEGDEEMVPRNVVDRLLDGENRVRVWREYRGSTVASLAARAGVPENTLSDIEGGDLEITIDSARKLADALELTLDDLLG